MIQVKTIIDDLKLIMSSNCNIINFAKIIEDCAIISNVEYKGILKKGQKIESFSMYICSNIDTLIFSIDSIQLNKNHIYAIETSFNNFNRIINLSEIKTNKKIKNNERIKKD